MHRTGQSFKLFLRMPMSVFIICHIMIMIMRMSYRVSMRRSVMRMGESVLMLMGMMQYKRIRHNQN